MKAAKLHVVASYSNPNRTQVRPRLLREWLPVVLESGAQVTLVEHAFGERPYEFSPQELRHVRLVQIRGDHRYEHWLQHAMYNRGIASLPDDAHYICWQDTDVAHVRKDWAIETLHMLQHNRVGQTWTHAIDMDPHGNVAANEHGNDVDRSFAAAFVAGDVDVQSGPYARPLSRAMLPNKSEKDWRSHTGYSWAIRRDAMDKLGRLIWWLIGGSADWHMAMAFAGKLRQHVEDCLRDGGAERYSAGYYRKLIEYADLCEEVIEQDIGVVPGTLLHGWHGSKKLRFYGAREAVLQEGRYDPDVHIGQDVHGLPFLRPSARTLRDGLRRYGRLRNEDSVDVY